MAVIRRPSLWFGLFLWLLAGILWVQNQPPAPHAMAQAVPIPAAAFNPYWGGFVATEEGPFSGVRASWAVPRVPCGGSSSRNATTYIWVGEGGYVHGLLSPLIQAGTASDCLNGMPRYHAFFEWYPGIYATDFPIDIRPGDTIDVRVEQPEPNYWVFFVRDETNGARSGMSTFFQADTASADFVVERPNLCQMWTCIQPDLAAFQQVTFSDITLRTADGRDLTRVADALPIALYDPDLRHLLAVPGRNGTSSTELSVLFRHGS